MLNKKPIIEPVPMPNGCNLYCFDNGIGGRTYHSDEVAGGSVVWDTSLIDMSTLKLAICVEEKLRNNRLETLQYTE